MPTPIPLDNTLGALNIGVFLSSIIYGITCLQVYIYFTERSGRDPHFLKSFVAFIMTLDMLHAALVAFLQYHLTVLNFGNLAALGENDWSLLSEVVIGTLLSTCIQDFYAWRVYHIGGKRIAIPICIFFLSLAKFGTGIALFVRGISRHFLVDLHRVKVLNSCILSVLSLDVFADILIAGMMVHYLVRNRSSISRTNKAVSLLVAYSMNTGLVTTLCAIACLVAWQASPGTFIFAPFYFVLVRLYSCSLLCMLNGREHVRQELSGTGEAITLSALTAGLSGSEGSNVSYSGARRHPSDEASHGTFTQNNKDEIKARLGQAV